MKVFKKYYMLFLLIFTLTVMGVYGTYAMFTHDINVDAVNLQASNIPVDQEISEYQKITVNANDAKTISLNISNSTSQALHYGAWYQMISPSTINDNITIAKLTDSPDETSGTIDGNSNKNVYIYIGNNSSSEITLYVGIKYSETSSLGLPDNRTLITNTRDGKYVVGVTVTNGTVENGVTLTNMLEDGNFENTGWRECTSYNTTYKKYGNYSCQLVGSSSGPETVVVHNKNLSLNNSHYYYSRVEGYQTSKNGNQEFQVYFPIAEPSLGTVSLGEVGKWNVYSVINNRSSFSNGNNYQLRFDYNNNYNADSVYYDGGMLLDLTESYGSSYPSKEILDRSIGYFDGSVSYNYQKLNKGNSTSFVVNPNSGYVIDSVSCTNSSANYSNNTLTITNITGDVQCNVKFKNSSRTSSEMLAYLGLSAKSGTPNFGSTATTDEGIYAAQDDYGTSYYFRGAVENNYVKFANKYWRIIRINGDGTIRLIYDGTSAHANGESSRDRQIGTSVYNNTYGDNAYVGYMMGIDNQCASTTSCSGSTRTTSYSQATSNTYSSTIKTTVDNWYKTNIVDAGYSDKVADVIYCNDRQIDTVSGYGNALGYGTNQTAYMPRYRIYTNKSPILTCTNQNDRFTVEDTSKGNGALTYPVGLITADETSMGGAVNGSSNSSYYLYTGQWYWTMSPYYFSARVASEFYVRSNGDILGSNVRSTGGVRPVLSLKSDISVTGSGTQNDPYVVQ